MKLKIILLSALMLVFSCKENLNKGKSSVDLIKKKIIKDNSTKLSDSISGFYFPLEIKECDFWFVIKNKQKKYIYSFYRGSKKIKTGNVVLKKEEENTNLSFENSFNSQYYKDTIVFQNYGNSMNEFENIPYCDLKYVTLVKDLKIDIKNLVFYNDKAYYLEQSKLYNESIYILEKIIEKFPDRTVAYINLGDSYWNSDKKERAKSTYKIYIEQMKEKEKEQKIPKRIFERVK